MVFTLVVNACMAVFVAWAAARIVRQRKRKKTRPRELVVSSLSGVALGAMLLGFQEIVQPQVRHMIVEEMREEAVIDENGEPPGGRVFHEQVRRIRAGEPVDDVTVRMEDPKTGAD